MKAFVTAVAAFGPGGAGLDGVTDGCIDDDALAGALTLRGLRPLSRTARLAMVAAAGVLPPGSPTGPGDGVVLGSAWSSTGPLADFVQVAAEHGPAGVFPMAFPNTVVSVHPGHVATLLGLGGPSVAVCGEHAGLEAALEAVSLLERGRAERVLALAADAAEPVVRAARPEASEGACALRLSAGPEADGCLAVLTGAWAAARPEELPPEVRWDSPTRLGPSGPPEGRTRVGVSRPGAVHGLLSVARAVEQVAREGREVVVVGRSGVRGVAALRLEPA